MPFPFNSCTTHRSIFRTMLFRRCLDNVESLRRQAHSSRCPRFLALRDLAAEGSSRRRYTMVSSWSSLYCGPCRCTLDTRRWTSTYPKKRRLRTSSSRRRALEGQERLLRRTVDAMEDAIRGYGCTTSRAAWVGADVLGSSEPDRNATTRYILRGTYYWRKLAV